MRESKLIKLLKRFDKDEVKRFKDFVSSPYYNKNRNTARVYGELIKFYPDFEDYSEETVYKSSFETEEFDYFAIKNILSDLHALAIKFILVEYKEERSISKEIRILEMLRDKQAFDEYKTRLAKTQKKLESEKTDSEFYLEDKHQLMLEEALYWSIFDPNTRFDLMQQELDTLVNFFIVKVVKHYCAILHELKQNNYPFKLTMIDDITRYLKGRSFEDVPIINLYKNIFFLQQTGEYKYYNILQELRDKYYDNLNRGDIYMLFTYMRSYTVVNFARTMDKKYLRDCFELDKFHLDKGIIPLGKILYPDFIAVVKNAASVGEFEWAEKFMDKMKHDLIDDVKTDALNFSYGYMEYLKGNLEKAMELIYKVNFNIFIMQIQVYIMLLRIYYEIGYYEDGLNLIKTAKEYLKKEIAIGEMQKGIKNFLDSTSALIKLRLSVKQKTEINYEKEKLRTNTEKMKNNYFGVKSWLLKQIKSLKV